MQIYGKIKVSVEFLEGKKIWNNDNDVMLEKLRILKLLLLK